MTKLQAINKLITNSIITKYLLAIFAGGALVLSFSPFNYWYLAYLSMIIMMKINNDISCKHALGMFYSYGIAVWGVGSYWLMEAFYINGNASYIFSLAFTIFVVVTLALYSVLKLALYRIIFQLNFTLLKSKKLYAQLMNICLFASCWVVVDWLQGSLLFGGQSNLYISYSQVDTFLSGFFPLIGDLGVTWIIVFLSGIIYIVLGKFLSKQFDHIIYLFLIMFSFIVCGLLLKNFAWTIEGKDLQRVVLVQGNTPPIKDYANTEANIKIYENLTEPYWQQKSKNLTVIWPEGVVGKMLPGSKNLIKLWHNKSLEAGITMIVGIPNKITHDKDYSLLSSIIAVGVGNGISYKNHLVPWGEYIPLKQFFGFLKFYDPSITKYVTAESIDLYPMHLQTSNSVIAPFICFDINYQGYFLDLARGSNVLLTISNNSWFGDTTQAWQYLQIAQVRALETQRYHLLATNDGVTAIINPWGVIQKILPRFERTTLVGDVLSHTGNTPIMLIGGARTIAFGCLFYIAFLLVIGVLTRLRKRRY